MGVPVCGCCGYSKLVARIVQSLALLVPACHLSCYSVPSFSVSRACLGKTSSTYVAISVFRQPLSAMASSFIVRLGGGSSSSSGLVVGSFLPFAGSLVLTDGGETDAERTRPSGRRSKQEIKDPRRDATMDWVGRDDANKDAGLFIRAGLKIDYHDRRCSTDRQ